MTFTGAWSGKLCIYLTYFDFRCKGGYHNIIKQMQHPYSKEGKIHL